MALQIQIEEIYDLVSKDFLLHKGADIDTSNFDKLKEWLAIEIQLLIDRNFHGFLNLLYRIDVDEQKAKEAFACNDPSMKLAELIIERELQKVESRKKYK